jgi:hypothetical protein
MFLKNSRYASVPIAAVRSPRDTDALVTVVKQRRLPDVSGAPFVVRGHDQLDAISETRYADATRYWHIADANSEIDAAELTATAGRAIEVPES